MFSKKSLKHTDHKTLCSIHSFTGTEITAMVLILANKILRLDKVNKTRQFLQCSVMHTDLQRDLMSSIFCTEQEVFFNSILLICIARLKQKGCFSSVFIRRNLEKRVTKSYESLQLLAKPPILVKWLFCRLHLQEDLPTCTNAPEMWCAIFASIANLTSL